jgi:hypothetical protein
MLAIDFEIEKEGMTVPYPPLSNDIRCNHGFVDLRGRPDLAIEIPEGSQSPALKAILVELSEPDSHLSTLFEFHPRFFPQWLYSVASSRFQASRAFTARPIL